MKDQKGTTLVSVIVSFAVLMVVMLLLQVSISASGRYAARAEEIWEQAAAAENKYMDDGDDDRVHFKDVALHMMCSDGADDEVWGYHMHIDKTKAVSGNDIVFYYVSTREYTGP